MQRYLGKAPGGVLRRRRLLPHGRRRLRRRRRRGALHRPPHRDDQDRRRQRVARRARGAAAGLPAGEAGPHRRRARRRGSTSSWSPASPSRTGPTATEADIQAFLRERVAAYKVPKRVLFFARRRDPDDRQRHQGPRRRRSLALVEDRLASRPRHRTTRPETDDRHAEALDASDLDQYMGVPMEPGELKDPVALNDIRRWVQAMHYPNPLHYDERWAGREPLRRDHRPAVLHGGHRHQPRLLAGPGRQDPELAPHLRRRRLVVLRPPHRARRPLGVPPHALRLQGHRHELRRARPASSAATRSTSTRRASGSPCSGPPPSATRSARPRRRRPSPRPKDPEWTDEQLAELDEQKQAVHRPDPDAAPRPAALREREGRRPAGRRTCSGRTASPASPPSGGPSR